MKKLIIFILTFLTLISTVLCVPASASFDTIADTLGLHSDTYFLMNLDKGTVIFSSNADKQCPLASLTKIVTATVVLENCSDLETVVAAPEYCIKALLGTGSSIAGIKPGEELTVNDLLHCLLIESANDAAMVLADYIGGGDIDAFVAKMNDLADAHGCTNTNFVNPHGLDDEYQFSSPRDIANLAVYALTFPVFKEIVSLNSYTVPATNFRSERRITNTNYLMNPVFKDYYCEYASGVKTGSTSKAGKCVVSTASDGGYNYVGVVMNAPMTNIDDDEPEENCAFVDCKTMFDWVIDNIQYVKISDAATVVAEVPVELSWSTDHVTLAPKENSYELVPAGTSAGSVLIEPIADTVPRSIDAPVKKGDVVCKANVLYAGEAIATIDLVATADVKRSVILLVLDKLKSFVSLTPVKIILIAAAAFFAVLVILRIKNKIKKRRRGNLHVVTYNGRRK